MQARSGYFDVAEKRPFIKMTFGTAAGISIILFLSNLVYSVTAEPYVDGDRNIFPADATNVELHTYTGDSGVPDTYIVKLKQGVDPQTALKFVDSLKSDLYFVTNGRSSAFENDPSVGVMMDFGDTKMVVVETHEEGLRLLRRRVDVVEAIYQDSIVTTAQAPVCHVPCECMAAEESVDNNVCPQRTAATDWGLDRIDQPNGQLDGKFNVKGTGSDVNVYIFDSGIYAEHQEFSNSDGYTRVTPGVKALNSWNFTDINGHGTHMAGIIGGKTVGVAKNVNLINVKILNDTGSGYVSWTIWGMYQAAFPILATGQKSIMVLALQSSRNDAFNAAIHSFTNYGITVITGSGNNNGLSYYQSPGSSEAAITVGASAVGDTKAIYSNYGPEVDIWAPGTDILSSTAGSPDAYDQRSGTSVAAAFVAGAAAAFMSSLDYRPAPAEVAAYLNQQATENVITDSPTEHNCRWEATCTGAYFWSCRINRVCDSISTTTRFLHVGCYSDATDKK